ncbi:MAG: T9SS type A sorting domain-containing protein [Bacteroidota bacterium]
MKTSLGLCLLAGLLSFQMFGSEKPERTEAKQGQPLGKTAQTKDAALLNVNNFTTWLRANGQGQQPPSQISNGSQFPRGTTHPIYSDGFVWGGKCYLDAAKTQPAPTQLIRVGGNTYNVGNVVGWIDGTGASAVAVSSTDPRARVYRIRRDYLSMTDAQLRLDAAENNEATVNSVDQALIEAVLAQYAKDWSEWPAGPTNDGTILNLGAPYVERNGIPGYQRPPTFGPGFTVDSLISGKYDEPGVAGSNTGSPASQVVWTVFNDLSRGNMIGFEGSEPMGLEGQITLWGYNSTGALGNLYFKRIKLINKGGAVVNSSTQAKGNLYIDSMFVAQWSDPDLGNAGDDLAGCDSLLSVGFVYNGNAVDNDYSNYNVVPPAVGYDFLAGPAIPGSASDTAIFDLKPKPGFKNLGMSSFCWFAAGNSIASDPQFNYEGGLRWWKLLRGFLPNASTLSDISYPGPPATIPTKFPLAGDPFKGTGSLDGLGTSYSSLPGDRRIVLSTGPFLLSPLDTQEVTMGVIGGLGADRLSSVAVMKSDIVRVSRGLHGAPIAGLEPVKDIYSVPATVSFNASAFMITGTVANTKWLIIQKPPSSSAQVTTLNAYHAQLQPDIPGVYKVAFVAAGNNGLTDTAFTQMQATHNTAPVVNLQTAPGTLAIGDTLHLNGSGTIDADGESLQFTWNVTGNDIFDKPVPYDTLRGKLINPTSPIASYVPVRATTLAISLGVRDSFFTSAAAESVIVNPLKTANVQVSGVYHDGTFPGGGFYSHGPIKMFSDNSIWAQNDGNILRLNFSNFLQPTQSYVPFQFPGNFFVSGNVLAFAAGYSGAWAYNTDGVSQLLSGNMIRPVSPVLSTDSVAYDVFIKNQYLVISYGTAGLYVYNISNPGTPIYSNQYSNGQKWVNFAVDGSLLFAAHSLTQKVTVLDLTIPSTPLLSTTINTNRGYSGIKKLGQFFYLFKSDTIAIYDFSSLNAPVLKSEIPVPTTLNPGNTIYDVSGQGNILMVGTAEGVYFYDVSNPGAPVLKDKFITGYEAVRVFFGSGHILSNSYGRGLLGGYEGFTTFNVLGTDVENSTLDVMPASYRLSQNFPNPFNPLTRISYSIPVSGNVVLKVIDILGREVASLVNEQKAAGNYTVTWEASKVASGVYFYRLESGKFSETKKLVFIK